MDVASTAAPGVGVNATEVSIPPFATAAAGLAGVPPSLDAISITLQTVLSGLQKPLFLVDRDASSPGSSLLAVEKAGRIRLAEEGTLRDEPWLDITDRVGSDSSEQGLLGLALHPGFAQNGRLFVHYTDVDGDTQVSELFHAAGEDSVDPATERQLLHVDQPAANHNGGMLVFGPDGYLYIGMGDGGGHGDPHENGQNPRSLLAKVLRIDVDAPPAEGAAYAIPTGNPFAGNNAFAPETWAWGLRNPWRFSFDRLLGDLYIGDVGEAKWEEINLDPRQSRGGENFGWPLLEGSHCYVGGCDKNDETVRPILEYSHDDGGCSVTGGYVYRGSGVPGLQGVYVYGDYCSGKVWGALAQDDGRWASRLLLNTDLAISSFAEDAAGELYILDLDGGTVSRITN